MNTADILEKAADLLTPEGAWTQGAFARRADGEAATGSDDPAAVCWCVAGAINQTGRKFGVPVNAAHTAFENVIGAYQFGWNDAPERTQAEVVAKLREAAALAREQQQ